MTGRGRRYWKYSLRYGTSTGKNTPPTGNTKKGTAKMHPETKGGASFTTLKKKGKFNSCRGGSTGLVAEFKKGKRKEV